mmetsp:Transcript_34238/g.103205  ORF Transcript_34238/g.103205 Transcript_34238/m.103205 type:complete len:350 (+) Transcript_34238:675-1724(+)
MDPEAGEERAAIAHQEVDARDDLEELRQAADEHHVAEVGLEEDLAPRGAAGALLLLQLRLHQLQLPLGQALVARAEPREHSQGLLGLLRCLQEARRLAEKEQAHGPDRAQEDLDAQRPAPAAAAVLVEVVQHGGGHDSEADVALVDADHGAPDLCWRHLRDVGRPGAGRDAHAHARHQPANDEHGRTGRQALDQAAQAEECRADDERRAAPEAVHEQVPAEHCRDGGADVEAVHGQPLLEGHVGVILLGPAHHRAEAGHGEDVAHDAVVVPVEQARHGDEDAHKDGKPADFFLDLFHVSGVNIRGFGWAARSAGTSLRLRGSVAEVRHGRRCHGSRAAGFSCLGETAAT